MTEDKRVGWHPRLNGHGFEEALGDREAWEAWRAAVHGVVKSRRRLSDQTPPEGMKAMDSKCSSTHYLQSSWVPSPVSEALKNE